ncbi:Late embryogenesis abundant protein [Parasponia andersonii]|uniref:Late embryogenesis abundant protein n=1 Tax=Parasponia andersonii TaxID=3476 RepID=A0A2P5DZU4_PARAD|nr:Late embryogenesis abundant protein [Parasponia andersonii]
MADPSRPVTGYPAQSYPLPPTAAANSNPNPNGVGYPYPAAPQPPYHHPYPNNPNPNYAYPYNYDASRATFLRRLIAAMIAFFIISASIIFIIWLVLRPRLPKVRVDSLSLTNFNTSSSPAISGNWDVGFAVYNPNKKMSITYDEIGSEVFYKSAFLSETRISPFSQGTRTQTAINATFSAANSYVDDWVVKGIDADRGRGTVNFNVRVLARVGFRTGGWRLRRRLLRVLCENVGVGLSSSSGSGKLVGGARECRVGI